MLRSTALELPPLCELLNLRPLEDADTANALRAELAFALILALDRRVPDNVIGLRQGEWNKELFSRGFVLVPLAEIGPDLVLDGVSVAQAAGKSAREGIVVWR